MEKVADRCMRNLYEAARGRILVLDGAMGTMIQRYGLSEADYRGDRFGDLAVPQRGNNELLTLTRPDVVAEIHRRYLAAGADIIETNTFSAQRISMADYGCEALCREMNVEAARLARREADGFSTSEWPRFVAGSMGPTNKSCSISPDAADPARRAVTYDELFDAYVEQATALLEGGVDALLVETVFDTLGAKAALDAALHAMERVGRCVPLMLSATLADRGGHTLSGQTLGAFLASVAHVPLFSVGLNCSFGAAEMKPFLARLAAEASCFVSAYPNAGLPSAMGTYDQTPEAMAAEMKHIVDAGLVNIIGGCCGTTDKHIACLTRLVRRTDGTFVVPRLPAARRACLSLAGLERLDVTPDCKFVRIGERCNVAGSRKFLRLIREGSYDEAVSIARHQVEAGAEVVDINMDDGMLDARKEMVHFLNLLGAEPAVARVPFMVDSSRFEVISAALRCIQGKCIVNSISLKEGEAAFLAHAAEARRFGAAVVVMAFDEKGQADTYERRIEVCARSYDLLTRRVAMPPEDIIFDPNVLAICTGMPEHDTQAADFIRATAWIRKNLPGAHVSGGVSNLSFAFRGNNYLREAMHAVFLHHAAMAGMDMGIVNPSAIMAYEDVEPALRDVIEDAILYRSADASERLISEAGRLANDKTDRIMGRREAAAAWRDGSVEERLAYALIEGVDDYLDADLEEALGNYPHAVDLIEGPLMDAMNRVGDLFGEGKMFLPQVVKTARTMKRAVAYLNPYIEKERRPGERAGRVLLATVKGDVHDIGKNIVAVILACNNYEVIDLGVMCPAEKIVEAVRREHPDMIGLSGLITPSLDEMVHTVSALRAAGMDLPVAVGGATTSRLHTALKIAPAYDGPVVWTKDASQVVPAVAKLLNPATRTQFEAQLRAEYENLRCSRGGQSQPLAPLDEARENRLKLF